MKDLRSKILRFLTLSLFHYGEYIDISDSCETDNSDDAGDPDFSSKFGEFSDSIEADEFFDSGETVNSSENVDSCGNGDSGE